MPPKAKITKEQIAEAAFEIIRRDGYDALNARVLAAEMGISTMPLFHYYESMDDIKKAAVDIAMKKYNSYMQEGMSESLPFKGVGRAYIRFAQDEPELFRMAFMMPTSEISGLSETDPNKDSVLSVVSDITGGSRESGEDMLQIMWLLVHGIATLAVTGKTRFSDEEISRILSNTFKGLKYVMETEDNK